MRPIEHESNVDVLRSYALLLEDEVLKLRRENETLRSSEEGASQERLTNLEDKLTRLKQKYFGSGQEKVSRPVGHKDEQPLLHGVYVQAGAEAKQKPVVELGKTSVQFTYHMSEKQLAKASKELGIVDEVGARAWREAKGLYQDHMEVTTHERIYQEVLHRQLKYRLRGKYNKTDKDEVLITAPGPAKVRPGSRYSVDFAIATVVDKYCDHIPLERQRRRMERAGFDVDVKTLYGLCEAVSDHCQDLLPRIKKDIGAEFCAVHIDETPWPIIGNKKKSYMWAMSNRRGAYYQFEPSRASAVGEEILRGYQGAVVSDAYVGHKHIKRREGQRLAHCWAHARREFFERRADYPAECDEYLEMVGDLFEIETKAKTFEELAELRRTRSKPLTEKIFAWLIETRTKFLNGQGISKAINYSLKHWQELTLFLDDLSVPLTNNDAERALRHVVVGRKNFGGSKTINGADVAATLYTVIESCKRVGVQPSQYLKHVIEEKWFKEKPVLTPFEYAMEKLGPNTEIEIPHCDSWQISQDPAGA